MSSKVQFLSNSYDALSDSYSICELTLGSFLVELFHASEYPVVKLKERDLLCESRANDPLCEKTPIAAQTCCSAVVIDQSFKQFPDRSAPTTESLN